MGHPETYPIVSQPTFRRQSRIWNMDVTFLITVLLGDQRSKDQVNIIPILGKIQNKGNRK